MAVLPIIPPRIVGIPGIDSPAPAAYSLAQAAAFREGDILAITTTGTIVTPTGGLSTLSTFAGPSFGSNVNLTSSSSTFTANNVTVAGSAVANAPATSYYYQLTYTATGKESMTGAEFIVNCAAGVVPNVTVSATGQPTGTTNWAAYVGLYSGGEALQQATTTTTATGAAFALTSPLVNNIGVNRAASNANAKIVGIAMGDSAAIYAQGVGGAANVGGPGNLLGAWGNPYPLGQLDAAQCLVAKLTGNAPVEISLKQAFSPALIGASFGLTLDATSGYFVADTGATAIGTITDKVTGVTTDVGTTGDTYSRVKCVFTSGVI